MLLYAMYFILASSIKSWMSLLYYKFDTSFSITYPEALRV